MQLEKGPRSKGFDSEVRVRGGTKASPDSSQEYTSYLMEKNRAVLSEK